ncbi:MAG: hypothetical protein KIS78_05100 [Labilithrix sp.]|nr:hypothetical protein [Labilithrix sp.]
MILAKHVAHEPPETPAAASGARIAAALWEHLTTEANAAFCRRDDARARALYEKALVEAERLFAVELRGPRDEPCVSPMLYAISLHNLADLARRGGDDVGASDLIRAAFERVVAVAESPDAPVALRASCVHNLGPALAELVADLEARGLTDEAAPLVQRVEAAARSIAASHEPDRPC